MEKRGWKSVDNVKMCVHIKCDYIYNYRKRK